MSHSNPSSTSQVEVNPLVNGDRVTVTSSPPVTGNAGLRLQTLELTPIARGNLVRKYGSPAKMPVWVLMELFSFGSFIDLYLFCANCWSDERMRHEHYMLRQVKSVRNACAHSSDILNGIGDVDTRIGTDTAVMDALAKAGISHRVRTAKMKNPRIRQIATLLYLHTQLVPAGSGKKNASCGLSALANQFMEMNKLVPTNDTICSSLAFLTKLIDTWFR
ncbi:MAG: Abi family protein [Eggerthellaceae bacterium]